MKSLAFLLMVFPLVLGAHPCAAPDQAPSDEYEEERLRCRKLLDDLAEQERSALFEAIDSSAEQCKVTLTSAARDSLISEYLCTEQRLLKRYSNLDEAVVREYGEEALKAYLVALVTASTEESVSLFWARRIGQADLKHPTSRQYWLLTVVVTPNDAALTLDGDRMSQPSTLLLPGTYTIEASKSGYRSYQREVEIKDSDKKVAIILAKSKLPQE
jgi:hypothetical protein